MAKICMKLQMWKRINNPYDDIKFAERKANSHNSYTGYDYSLFLFRVSKKTFTVQTKDIENKESYLPVTKYPLILRHDNRKFEGYERPCAGLEEVSLTLLTGNLK
jgi:hypothetical protein